MLSPVHMVSLIEERAIVHPHETSSLDSHVPGSKENSVSWVLILSEVPS